jgi:LmbE family N-acetylglucosaminyl deacetylase
MFGRRILVLSPHPDDETVGAAAAILRAGARGAAVDVAFLSDGVPSRELFPPWRRGGHAQRVARRWEEAEAAARLLGFTIALRLDAPTRTLKSRLGEARAAINGLIEKNGVDMLWTPAFEGAHQDHDAANCLAASFAPGVAVWEFAEYNNGPGHVLSQAFHAPNGAETALELNGEECVAKRVALSAYASERGNLRHIETKREAFRPLPKHDYTRPPHPGTLFYQRFQWVWPRHYRVDYTKPKDVAAALQAFRAGGG